MELVTASDLVVTASLALLLSLLVAKLVSMAMASDPHTHNTQQPIITLQQERLMVQKPQSESRVEFLGPIQVSMNVETEQNRLEEETEQNREEKAETKVESKVLGLAAEDIAVEFGVSNVGLLTEEHVEEEQEQELTESNEESEQQSKKEDFEEQRKTECVEDYKGKRKTEETTVEAIGVKESDQRREAEDCEENRETERIEDFKEQRKTEEITTGKSGVKESEQQRKTEETTVEPFNKKGISVEESNEKEGSNYGNVFVVDDDDDDDWEGIERSELEKVFMMATEFVGGEGDDEFGSDEQMELYGLHKIATEGPCREPQPMPLKLTARAKWNAWQKLGNMSPDVAMEQYISLVSDKVPEWKKDSSSAGMSEHEHKVSEVSDSAVPDFSTSLSRQQMIITESEHEQESVVEDHSTLTETDLENNVKK